MADEDRNADTVALLTEIRDNQRRALEMQREQLELVREQAEHTRASVAESIDLQRLAIRKQRLITRLALPAILLCIGLIVYLLVRYF